MTSLRIARYGSLWIGVACAVAAMLVPQNLPRLMAINGHPAMTTGVVTKILKIRRPQIAFSFVVDGIAREGKAYTGDCRRFRTGDPLQVYYSSEDATAT